MGLLKTTLLRNLYFLSLIVISSSCATTGSLGIKHDMYQGYMPTVPISAKTVEFYVDSTETFVYRPWEAIPDSLKLLMLPLQSAQISMRKIDQNGSFSYLPAAVSGSRGNYEIILDYMKYRGENVKIDSIYIGDGRVGIGLRIVASIVTNKSNLNLAGLGSLSLEASHENISGFLSVDIFGVDSKDITNHFPLVSKLDETSIQYALQAIATIKSKIWDKDVRITPHVIAVNQKRKDSEKLIKEHVADVQEFAYSWNSKILDKFVMPNGKTYDEKNKATLIEWMKQNDVPADAGDINMFIFSRNWEMKRQKAVSDLKLK